MGRGHTGEEADGEGGVGGQGRIPGAPGRGGGSALAGAADKAGAARRRGGPGPAGRREGGKGPGRARADNARRSGGRDWETPRPREIEAPRPGAAPGSRLRRPQRAGPGAAAGRPRGSGAAQGPGPPGDLRPYPPPPSGAGILAPAQVCPRSPRQKASLGLHSLLGKTRAPRGREEPVHTRQGTRAEGARPALGAVAWPPHGSTVVTSPPFQGWGLRNLAWLPSVPRAGVRTQSSTLVFHCPTNRGLFPLGG